MPAASPCRCELRDGSTDFAKLQSVTSAIVGNAQSQSALQHVSTTFRATAPQVRIDVDRAKAQTVHVSVDQGIQYARDLFRFHLRAAIQQIRPRVPSLRAGRRGVPAARARYRLTFGCATKKAT